MVYNVSYVANSSGLLQFIQRTNSELVSGWLGFMFLIMIFGITFLAFVMKTNDAPKSVCASLFICMGTGLMLNSIGILSNLFFWVTALFFAASVFYMGATREK